MTVKKVCIFSSSAPGLQGSHSAYELLQTFVKEFTVRQLEFVYDESDADQSAFATMIAAGGGKSWPIKSDSEEVGLPQDERQKKILKKIITESDAVIFNSLFDNNEKEILEVLVLWMQTGANIPIGVLTRKERLHHFINALLEKQMVTEKFLQLIIFNSNPMLLLDEFRSFKKQSTTIKGSKNLLQLSARPWLFDNNQNTILHVSFKQITECHFEYVWLMGVWKLTEFGLEFDKAKAKNGDFHHHLSDLTDDDIIGSPFAVEMPYTLSPPFSGLANFRSRLDFVKTRLILDFVPNHASFDCGWVKQFPEYFVRDAEGKILFGTDGWGQWADTAQFNYWNPTLRQAMTDQLLYIAQHCDGVRCDMAHLLLNNQYSSLWGKYLGAYPRPEQEFWGECIAKVKDKYPNFIFIAEAYANHHYLQSLGFDYVYNKIIYDLLVVGDIHEIKKYISRQSFSFLSRCCLFVSNHDERRAATMFGDKLLAATVITYTLPGLHLQWMNENLGYKHQIAVQLRRQNSEPVDENVKRFYSTLMPIISEPVFKNGHWEYLNVNDSGYEGRYASCWKLIAWRWSLGQEKRVCIVNYSDAIAQGRVVLSNVEPIDEDGNCHITELLSSQTFQRSVPEIRTVGLHVVINAWSAQIFKY